MENNIVLNGNFEDAPTFVAAQTTNSRWVNGTATGAVSSSGLAQYPLHASLTGAAGDKSVQFDSVDPHSGSNCFKIHINAGGIAEVRVNCTGYFVAAGIPVTSNTPYNYSVWAKSENVTGSAGGQAIQFLFSSASGASSPLTSRNGSPSSVSEFNALGSSINTNQPWTNFTGSFVTGPTAAWFHPEYRVYSHTGAATLAGDFYFDDIEVNQFFTIAFV